MPAIILESYSKYLKNIVKINQKTSQAIKALKIQKIIQSVLARFFL